MEHKCKSTGKWEPGPTRVCEACMALLTKPKPVKRAGES